MKSKEAIKAHAQRRKLRKGLRRKGILWDYNGDGIFLKEKMSSSEKRYWRRWKCRRYQIDL